MADERKYVWFEGRVRGVPVEFWWNRPESGAEGVDVVLQVEEWFDPGTNQWVGLAADDGTPVYARGTIWLTKKTGEVNQRGLETMFGTFGWDAMEDFNGRPVGWTPKKVGATVQRDDYKGETRFRIAWFNEYELATSDRALPSKYLANYQQEHAKWTMPNNPAHKAQRAEPPAPPAPPKSKPAAPTLPPPPAAADDEIPF